MKMRYPDFSKDHDGQLFDANRSNKGILRPALRKLDSAVTIEQTAEPRGLDYELESGRRPFRWSGPNPKPKILIPYAYPNEVRITLPPSTRVRAGRRRRNPECGQRSALQVHLSRL